MPLRKFDDKEFDSFVRSKFEAAPPASYDPQAWKKLKSQKANPLLKFWPVIPFVLILLFVGLYYFHQSSEQGDITSDNQHENTLESKTEQESGSKDSEGTKQVFVEANPVKSKEITTDTDPSGSSASHYIDKEEPEENQGTQTLASANILNDKSVTKEQQTFEPKTGKSQGSLISTEKMRQDDLSTNLSAKRQQSSVSEDDPQANNEKFKDDAGATKYPINSKTMDNKGDEGKPFIDKGHLSGSDDEQEFSNISDINEDVNRSISGNRQNQLSLSGRALVGEKQENRVLIVFLEPKALSAELIELQNPAIPVGKQLYSDSASEPIYERNDNTEGRVAIGILLNTDFSSVNFTDFTNPGFGTGLRFSYRILNKLHLNVGITKTNRIYNVNDRSDYSLPRWLLDNQGWPEGVEAKCNITEIPIGLRYDIIRNRSWTGYGMLSISTFLMDRELYDFR
ncbi:MAG: hypothetical protein WBA74_11020, partial [Cyclobacteriaceae bacterium]